MRLVFSLLLFMTAGLPVEGQELPSHQIFDRVLERFLHDGLVDYEGLQNDRAELDEYIAALGATDARALTSAPRAAQLAFWINAYNACALRLVIDHYPIQKRGLLSGLANTVAGVPANSIRQIPDTWKREFCPVAGKDRALDEIEHQIIRPMGDPRIHFAVNCASRSCPVLAPKAYTGESLDEQLDAAVRRFVTDPIHYRLDLEGTPTLYLNKVLDWYKDDFGGERGVVRFLIPYLSSNDATFVRAHEGLSVRYFEYDWTLNDTAVFGTG